MQKFLTLFTVISIYGTIHAQNSPVSFNIQELSPAITLESETYDGFPEILAVEGDVLWEVQRNATRFLSHFYVVRKRNVRSGELLFECPVEQFKFKDNHTYYSESYYNHGKVYLLYKTEKEKRDSVYLFVRIIDSEGNLSPPKVLASSWVEDKKKDDNINLAWNKSRTELSVLSVWKDNKTENAVIEKKLFNKNLDLNSVETFNTFLAFEGTSILHHLKYKNKTYALVSFQEQEVPAGGVIRFDSLSFKFSSIKIFHKHTRAYRIHEINGNFRFSYLSYEDEDHYKLRGYHSFDFDMIKGQRLLDNVTFNEELKETNKALYKFLYAKSLKGVYSIKSFIEHPNGGYVITLHKSYIDLSGYVPTYNAYNFLIMYIPKSGELSWQYAIATSSNASEQVHLSNFMSFDKEANYLLFLMDNTANIEYWQKHGFNKYKNKNSRDVGVSCVSISPQGEFNRKMLWIDAEREKYLLPSLFNLKRIGSTNEYYSWLITSNKTADLVKVSIGGLLDNGFSPHYLYNKRKDRFY